MTSTATVCGHFPLILATGAGAGARNSIGIVLVSGMIIGTLFTLFVVPVIYTFVARDRTHDRERLEAEGYGSSESQAYGSYGTNGDYLGVEERVGHHANQRI